MQGMRSLAASLHHLDAKDVVLLAAAWAAALVLSSLDQCTRGPSLTGMVLANLNRFF